MAHLESVEEIRANRHLDGGGDVEHLNPAHYALVVLRESAKQHRAAGDTGHATACERALRMLSP